MGYFPEPGDQFDTWQTQYATYLNANLLALRLCLFLATDSRTPYVASFDGGEANQIAHFIGRWMSTRNEPGPLSETVSSTVPG